MYRDHRSRSRSKCPRGRKDGSPSRSRPNKKSKKQKRARHHSPDYVDSSSHQSSKYSLNSRTAGLEQPKAYSDLPKAYSASYNDHTDRRRKSSQEIGPSRKQMRAPPSSFRGLKQKNSSP